MEAVEIYQCRNAFLGEKGKSACILEINGRSTSYQKTRRLVQYKGLFDSYKMTHYLKDI